MKITFTIEVSDEELSWHLRNCHQHIKCHESGVTGDQAILLPHDEVTDDSEQVAIWMREPLKQALDKVHGGEAICLDDFLNMAALEVLEAHFDYGPSVDEPGDDIRPYYKGDLT